MGKVFCVVDYYAENSSEKYWRKIDSEIKKIVSIPKHKVIHDRYGRRVCRPEKFSIENLANYGESYRSFKFYCNNLRSNLVSILENNKEKPNVIIALGGARILAWQIHSSLVDSDNPVLFGVMEMNRVVLNDRVVGFNYNLDHFSSNFYPANVKAIVVEDFINTGRSTEIAIKKIRKLGGEILAVVSFGNALGLYWPFEVSTNITFLNFDFTKIMAEDCPICSKKIHI
uniref:Phosphoribosyltransferase domain-containing protein n=1 Tax=candidate division CPR3 bacterium TaxID=2268181 RepID=A0A7C4M0B6_UNCC3